MSIYEELVYDKRHYFLCNDNIHIFQDSKVSKVSLSTGLFFFPNWSFSFLSFPSFACKSNRLFESMCAQLDIFLHSPQMPVLKSGALGFRAR